jgi:hypothetical protein
MPMGHAPCASDQNLREPSSIYNLVFVSHEESGHQGLLAARWTFGWVILQRVNSIFLSCKINFVTPFTQFININFLRLPYLTHFVPLFTLFNIFLVRYSFHTRYVHTTKDSRRCTLNVSMWSTFLCIHDTYAHTDCAFFSGTNILEEPVTWGRGCKGVWTLGVGKLAMKAHHQPRHDEVKTRRMSGQHSPLYFLRRQRRCRRVGIHQE